MKQIQNVKKNANSIRPIFKMNTRQTIYGLFYPICFYSLWIKNEFWNFSVMLCDEIYTSTDVQY